MNYDEITKITAKRISDYMTEAVNTDSKAVAEIRQEFKLRKDKKQTSTQHAQNIIGYISALILLTLIDTGYQ